MANFDQYTQNDAATIESILSGLGFGNTGAYANLIDAAIRQGWTDSELEAHLYDSQAFKNQFPGIFRDDGSLRVSPSDYRTLSDQYMSTARIYGVNLDKSRIGSLINGDVSTQEFTDRMEAIQRVSEFKPALQQFKQALQARGIDTKGLNSDEELANFILGKGPEQFYKIWEETQIGTSAKMAGLNLGAGLTKSIAKKTPGISSEADLQAKMQDLAKHITSTMPMSKIQKMGLTKKDLVQLEFGGPKQAQIFDKVSRIMKADEAFHTQDQAHTGGQELGRTQQQYANA